MPRTSSDSGSRRSGSRPSAGRSGAAPRRTRGEGADNSPSRYIAKISLGTGQELATRIDPGELLVHAHRDKHPVELAAQFLASRVIEYTGRERAVRRGLRRINSLGGWMGEAAGALTGSRDVEREAKKLLGVTDRVSEFRFRELTPLSEKEVRSRVERLQREARTRLRERGRNPRLQVLLTGATGFLGKEILHQAASDRRIAQVIAVVRPQKVCDRKTGKVLRVIRPQQRGRLLLKQLRISAARAEKFRFIEGDIEKPDLGIAPRELARLRKSVTHVIHCAASVSFDDTYENSYRANVLGCRNALEFSLAIQQAQGSSLIQHIAIETSYIHGRKKASMAQENALVFPRHFYNNYYELTKAMASIETDRHLIEKGLRVVQLLPSIVIGDSRTGNNRGDTKVVNAPINAFGRTKQALRAAQDLPSKLKAWMVGAVANSFPADPSAQLNLVPVDRVVNGILAALSVPDAIGTRIHLATDNRIRTEDVVRVSREELGVKVRLADPTIYRNLTLPVVKATLSRMDEPRLAAALEKLGMVFGGYSEWGQPIHTVGNDVRILGLSIRRPNTINAFRMLCRHNRYVQEFGKVRDPDEITRREGLWERVIDDIELNTGRQVGAIPPQEFRRLLKEAIDLRTFQARRGKRLTPARRAREKQRG